MEDVSWEIFGAAVMVAAVTILVKIVGLVRELVAASRLGRGDVLDAFIMQGRMYATRGCESRRQ